MSISAASQNGSDVVLAEVVEEFTNRLNAGERVDVESYIHKHPEHAERIRQLLPALELLAEVGRSASPDPDGALAESRGGALAGTLGDFRLIREVGKGGMGVVYEAEQVSLRRRVALKVLPFAATMDPRHLQRFHNEAQAAACLHHTNIVPVFSVGCERGVHFYAMQFIDGQTLSDLIRQLRQAENKTPAAREERTTAYRASPDERVTVTPAVHAAGQSTPLTSEGKRGRDYYRKVAELGVQAAEALDHAHQVGIVHRDIKPGNLMLDGRGNLWVTDFGLAHMQHGEANLTVTGQAVGTPRYMSPEQALAKRVPIDHRTDVYSLGVTLYELLTLRPAFGSEDRQELLRQIAFEDPARPRRLERTIPAELEIIVLKAMEKRPQDRYATAQELADDLRRWLLDQPIRARRPSWLQAARKWARRHQTVVRAASLLLLVLLVLGAGNALWWVRKQTEAETEARAALQEAARWQQDERWSEALSAVRRGQGVLRGLGADASLRREIDQLGMDLDMAQRLEEARLLATALKDGQFDVEACVAAYAKAFAWYGLDVEHLGPGEAGEWIRSRSIRMQLVAALDQWAVIRQLQKREEWTRLVAVARSADQDEWRNRLRDAWERRDGKVMDDLLASADVAELPPASLALLLSPSRKVVSGERVAALLRRTQQRHPADFWINHKLASLLRESQPPQLEEAIRYYMIAVALRPQSPGAHLNLGVALQNNGQLDEAIAEYHEAIRLKKDYAEAHSNLGDALRLKGRLDEAIDEYHEAIRLKKDLAQAHSHLGIALTDKGRLDEAIDKFREDIRLKKDDAVAHSNLGHALFDKDQLDEAIAEYREAIRIKKDDHHAHNGLGVVLNAKGQLDEAIAEFREAIRIKQDYAEAHCNLGGGLHGKGHLDEAIDELREAIRLKKDDALSHYNLGVALRDKGRLDEAIPEYREAIRLKKDDAKAHLNLGGALHGKGHLDEAIAEYQEAIRIKKDFAEAHCNLGNALLQKGQFRQAVKELRCGHELGSRNPRWPYPSAQRLQNAEKLAQLDDRLSAVLKGEDQPKDAGESLGFAQLCQLHRKQYAAAARFYGEAFTAEPKLIGNQPSDHRYNAACAAALAGCGQGQDAAALDEKERARHRKQALDWLRADLEAWRKLREKEPDKARPLILPQMGLWLVDTDFAGVRGEKALAKLPEEERFAWRKLWEEVEALRQRATKPNTH